MRQIRRLDLILYTDVSKAYLELLPPKTIFRVKITFQPGLDVQLQALFSTFNSDGCSCDFWACLHVRMHKNVESEIP